MGASLETRVPLLDKELIEFAWRVPTSMKVRHGNGKWLMRETLYRHVPKKLIDRPKRGFGVPLEHWLRGELRESGRKISLAKAGSGGKGSSIRSRSGANGRNI